MGFGEWRDKPKTGVIHYNTNLQNSIQTLPASRYLLLQTAAFNGYKSNQ